MNVGDSADGYAVFSDRGRCSLLLATSFVVVLVQLNTGCTGDGFSCETGFPCSTFIWNDLIGPRPFAWDILFNAGLGVFALILLFKSALPLDWRVRLQHGLAVSVAAFFSWRNPWRQTYAWDAVLGNVRAVDAGFPFTYRYVDDSPDINAIFLINVAIGFVCVFALFAALKKWTPASTGVQASDTGAPFTRWLVVVGLLFSYVQINDTSHRITNGYSRGFPFDFEASSSISIPMILDVAIGIALLVISLRYVPGTSRRGTVAVFAAFYLLANFRDWRWMHNALNTEHGRGFPFAWDTFHDRFEDKLVFMAVNAALGMLTGYIVYRGIGTFNRE